LTSTVRDVLAAARGIADSLLFPDAMRVDGLDALPVAHLDALAALGLYGAPAGASELAVRAAAALAVQDGSRSVTADQHAPRLAREALFLLVFGSRPGIKSALLRRLGASP
jgi:hypothetical protein